MQTDLHKPALRKCELQFRFLIEEPGSGGSTVEWIYKNEFYYERCVSSLEEQYSMLFCG